MRQKKIFIVCGMNVLLLGIKKSLERTGAFIAAYQDPMPAIKDAVQMHPDIVIADYQFSDIMGLEVLQQIKIRWPEIKTILLVNSENDTDVRKARELGSLIVKKPINYKNLYELVEQNASSNKSADASDKKNIMIMEKSANIRFGIKKHFAKIPSEFTEIQNPFELIEKFYLKNWDIIFFDIDNDFMTPEDFLKLAIEKNFSPIKFVFLSSEWTMPKQDRFISNKFPFFLKIPLDDKEVQSVLNDIFTGKYANLG